jgi:hypothetical protein
MNENVAVLAKVVGILVIDRGANAADFENRRKEEVTDKVNFIVIVLFF